MQSKIEVIQPRNTVSPDAIYDRLGQRDAGPLEGADLAELSVLRTAAELRERIAVWRAENLRVALVPTMGNLHSGHLSLAELAAAHADKVVMTIYVNPTQFAVGEDFDAYPRTLDEDRRLATESGYVDALFVPESAEIYPAGPDAAFTINVPVLSNELCGAHRHGHFGGVATVVLRLLNIVAPDLLVLGRKDFQQFVILKKMIEDLRMQVVVIAGATQRHADGLAISSRNRYLDANERTHAPVLHAVLAGASKAIHAGRTDYAAIESQARADLKAAGLRADYVEVRHADSLGKPNGAHAPSELIVLAAAWLGNARLIDNVQVDV